MRILIISGSLGDGRCGVGDFAFHLSRAIASARGVGAPIAEVSAVTATRADAIAARHSGSIAQAVGGASIWTAPECDFFVRTGFDFGLMHARDLRASIADARPDAILIQYPSKGYAHTLSIPFLGYMRIARIPYVVTVHEYRDAHPFRKIAIRALVSRAARVITPCPLEAVSLERIARCDVTVIPDGNVFACEIDEARYGAMKHELDAISTGGARFAWLAAHAGEYGESSIGENRANDLGLLKALEVIAEHQDFRGVFTYGFVAKTKAPIRIADVFERVLAAAPDARLIVASSIDEANPLHSMFAARLREFDAAATLTGALPPYILKYIAEKCRLQLYTFKDGYTTKRSSVISALSFATPILTERPIGSRELPLESVEAGDCEAMARRAAHVLAMDDDEYAEYRSERLAAHAHYAKSLSFETIAVEYIDAVSDAIRA